MSVRISKLAEPACTPAKDGVFRKVVAGVQVGSHSSSGVESTGIHCRTVEMIGSNFRDSFGSAHL